MGKNWITTVAGLVAAIGTAFTQIDPTYIAFLPVTVVGFLKAAGAIMAIVGVAVLGWAAKQYNVTGGTVPQASPPGVALKSDALGVIDAVTVMQKQGTITVDQMIAKSDAEAVVAAPPVSPVDVKLFK